MRFRVIALLWGVLAALFCHHAYAEEDIATRLMRSTFRLQGAGTNNLPVIGTVFVIAEPASSNTFSLVLVTAAHVLEDIKSDKALLLLRVKKGDSFEKLPWQIALRTNGSPLWVRHADVDVAAMRVMLPPTIDLSVATTALFSTDQRLIEFEVHPGDEVFVLGFPLGAVSHPAGFPILRSGRIASYPLTPMAKTKTFLLDFQVFPGNSGGPVVMLSQGRTYRGSLNATTIQMVMGVVSKEMSYNEKVVSLEEESVKKHKLALGVIVSGSLVREVFDQLPPPSKNMLVRGKN